MKIIENPKPVSEKQRSFLEIIGSFINDLKKDETKNRKKIIEVCHVGKFLMLLDEEHWIERLHEEPDFIVKSHEFIVGLEHQIVVDPIAKEREGFFENVFSQAEQELKADNDFPNFFASCYVKSNVGYKLSDRKNLVGVIKKVVKLYVLTGNLLPNPLIDRIRVMPHSQKNVNAHFGAWWQKGITPEIISSAVAKKESKLQTYIQNSVKNQWLLLVIGSLNDSSYTIESEFNVDLTTKFDKVYLLEDFNARLFELK